MKTSEEYRALSKERLSTAKHILDITYPALGSARLFLSALEHLFLSMDYAMNAILFDERNREMAGEFPKTFSGRYSAFRLRVADKLGFGMEEVQTLLTLRNILLTHQKSTMEFEREGKFIICTNDYEMTILSSDALNAHALAAGAFIGQTEKVLGKPLSIRGTPTP